MDKQRICDILPYLPDNIRKMLDNILFDEWIEVEEIRLRSNAPLTVQVWGEGCFITSTGGMTNYESDAYKVTQEEVNTAFRKVCENSVYAHLEELRRGYITVKGGHRVGVCGRAVTERGEINSFKEISSLNIRIAREIIGIADGVIDRIINGTKIKSTLIISPPLMGKTTLLRDILRQVSDRGFKCGLADDRGEIAAMYQGLPTNRIGAQTDVIDSAPKSLAIEILVRTMSPKVIISDEIGSEEDALAVLRAAGTGVEIIASCHGDSLRDVMSRRSLKPLFEDKIFKQAIILKRDFLNNDSVTYTEVVEL